MYHLTTVFPRARDIRLPVTRDQLMLLMAALNELFLSVDIYLAHNISGDVKPFEWIPIVFGAVGGVLLLLAGLLAFKQRPLATVIANLVFVGSIVVGLMGGYFTQRTILLSAPGRAGTDGALVWAASWDRSPSR
jgi:hypothetical protein